MKLNKHNRSLAPIVPPRAVAFVAGTALALAGAAPAAAARTQSHDRARTPTHETESHVTALAKVITRLEAGSSVAVSLEPIAVADTSTKSAEGRPMEFAIGTRSYLAYTLNRQPNFTISPRATAESMKIVALQLPDDEGVGPPLTQAHLNANHVLVDAALEPVGFAMSSSTSGTIGTPAAHS